MSSCFVFHARDCRVETPESDSLRLQMLQNMWTAVVQKGCQHSFSQGCVALWQSKGMN